MASNVNKVVESSSFFLPVTPKSVQPQQQVSPGDRLVSKEAVHEEAQRLANGFVSAILASAMADYVTMQAEADQDGRKLVTSAQVSKKVFTN